MTDIIEQCARAMCIAMGDDPDREGKGVVLTAYHDGARAALAKFKELTAEPTPAMMWRNGITNTDIIFMTILKRHDKQLAKSKAGYAFIGELNPIMADWWNLSRAANPQTYEESEAIFNKFKEYIGI